MALPAWVGSSEFSVAPIRIELRPGTMSETVSVTNHAEKRLRVNVKLVEWSQDATGQDVYKDSTDLIYFPRQLDLEPEVRRLVRVGVKAPAGVVERTYRLFIEEEAEQESVGGRAQVAFHFRFAVPIFLPPATGRSEPEIGEPTLDKGKLHLLVGNKGNQHFRLSRITVTDGALFTKDIAGWYSLAGTTRTYTVDIPRDVCQRSSSLQVRIEGEGENLRFERKVSVDAARCL